MHIKGDTRAGIGKPGNVQGMPQRTEQNTQQAKSSTKQQVFPDFFIHFVSVEDALFI